MTITIHDSAGIAPAIFREIEPDEIPAALIAYAAWHNIDSGRVRYSHRITLGELPQ